MTCKNDHLAVVPRGYKKIVDVCGLRWPRSMPIGIAICGIRTLSRKDEVVKEEPQEWNFCQTFALALLFLRVVLAFALHGKPITMKEYNMYWSLLGVGVDSAILYFGGFWKRKGE